VPPFTKGIKMERDLVFMAKSALSSLAEECMRLEERLGTEGIPCGEHEMQLIRLALNPQYTEALEMLHFSLLTGKKDFFKSELSRLEELAHF
jgi:hypothetical protein